MAASILVRRRGFHQVDELISEFDKGVARPFAAQREVEDLAVEVESLVDVADLKGDVINTDKPRFLGIRLTDLSHGLVPCRKRRCRTI